ncbi:hypothetical protein HYV73_03540 [Candidatus Uhrbacteria bacterium]|nr:hypothetical protein [Candidatus Uhrbacteria bacterium]
MNNAIEKRLGEKAELCDVCELPIVDMTTAIFREYLGMPVQFCSQACYKKYLESPETYTEFQEDEEKE